MQTRSMTRQLNANPVDPPRQITILSEEFDDYDSSSDYDPLDIDFDEASVAWRQNKRPIGNGCFEYKTPIRQDTGRMVLRSHTKK